MYPRLGRFGVDELGQSDLGPDIAADVALTSVGMPAAPKTSATDRTQPVQDASIAPRTSRGCPVRATPEGAMRDVR